jgi:Glycosyltransferase Family 4
LAAFCRTWVGLIHAHEFDAYTYGPLAGRLAGVPVVATVHGHSYYADCGRRRLAYRAVSRAAVMVAVSEDVKRFVVERTGVSARQIRVVHNGIGPVGPVSEEMRARLRADSLVVYFPSRGDFEGQSRLLKGRVLGALRESGVISLDLTSCVRETGPERAFIAGGKHYSAAGNAAVARCLLPMVSRLARDSGALPLP